MQVRRLSCVACFLLAFSATAADKQAESPLPNDWREWKASQRSNDAALVRSLEKMKWSDLCAAWGPEARKKDTTRRGHAIRDKLLADQLINGIDLGAVSSRRPEVGQTVCGVLAMLGAPDDINITESQASVSQQLVYRSKGIYVRTRATPNNHNGTVTSISY